MANDLPGKLRPIDIGKTALSLSTITTALAILSQYGRFKYPDFQLTAFHRARIAQILYDAVSNNRLFRGKWRPRTWIGVVTLSRLTRSFLRHATEHGTVNWDAVVAKMLSVTLVSALGARSGDVVLTRGYKGSQYLQYRHIRLSLEDGPPTVDNLVAQFTLEFTKGCKESPGDDVVRFIAAVKDRECFHLSPLHWLLVHTLRHDLVEGGSSIQQVLDYTAAQSDRCIRWKYPDRPVLVAFHSNTGFCQLDKAADCQQVNSTIKEMGILGGVLNRVYAHGLRHGSAREVAHLPKASYGEGLTDGQVRESLGHSNKALTSGVTEAYVGGSATDMYAARIANRDHQHRREPDFAASASLRDIQRAPVSEAEISAELERRGKPVENTSELSKSLRCSAFKSVREQRVRDARKDADAEARNSKARRDKEHAPAPLAPEPMRPFALQEISSNVPRSTRSAKRKNGSLAQAKSERSPDSNPAPPNPALSTDSPGYVSEEYQQVSNIDPALLDEQTLGSMHVHQAALDQLSNTVFPIQSVGAIPSNDDSPEGQEANEIPQDDEEAERLMLGDPVDSKVDNGPPLTAEGFVDSYARCHVVRNVMFATAWAKYSAREATITEVRGTTTVGGSRDDPSSPLNLMLKSETPVACAVVM